MFTKSNIEEEHISNAENEVPKEKTKKFKSSISEEYMRKTIENYPEAGWTKSKDGNDLFFHLGYTYKINKCYVKKNGDDVKYLRCIVELCSTHNKLCNGVLAKQEHDGHKCSPDPTKLAHLNGLHQAREAARNTHLKPSEICTKVLEQTI